jgi:predicted nuclease with TOPRIM domain
VNTNDQSIADAFPAGRRDLKPLPSVAELQSRIADLEATRHHVWAERDEARSKARALNAQLEEALDEVGRLQKRETYLEELVEYFEDGVERWERMDRTDFGALNQLLDRQGLPRHYDWGRMPPVEAAQ